MPRLSVTDEGLPSRGGLTYPTTSQRYRLGTRDLLRVLTFPSCVRADLIRQMYARADTRELADVLIDLEGDERIRLQEGRPPRTSTSLRCDAYCDAYADAFLMRPAV
jgi:hypothetical protein